MDWPHFGDRAATAADRGDLKGAARRGKEGRRGDVAIPSARSEIGTHAFSAVPFRFLDCLMLGISPQGGGFSSRPG
jgi:hypothetical protein